MRILFVDDVPKVLDGLKRLLWRHRDSWEVAVVASGAAALEELEKAPFDVVVSDMRMRGMDGAALLTEVKERFPTVARIVLSGYADRDHVLRALPVSQQYLHKPCDAARLVSAIERAGNLQPRLATRALRALDGRSDVVPPIPELYWELTRAASDPRIRTAEVAAIVQRDPRVSAVVLQVASSERFGFSPAASAIEAAVEQIGVELVRTLVVSTHVFGHAERRRPALGKLLDAVQSASARTARLARDFLSDRHERDVAFAAATVHEIGRIALALHAPERTAEALRIAAETCRPLHVVEGEVFGASHAEVGAYLLGTWALPLEIVEPVAYHHEPGRASPEAARLTAALHAATVLVAAEDGEARIDLGALDAAGLLPELPRWRARAAELERYDLDTTA